MPLYFSFLLCKIKKISNNSHELEDYVSCNMKTHFMDSEVLYKYFMLMSVLMRLFTSRYDTIYQSSFLQVFNQKYFALVSMNYHYWKCILEFFFSWESVRDLRRVLILLDCNKILLPELIINFNSQNLRHSQQVYLGLNLRIVYF